MFHVIKPIFLVNKQAYSLLEEGKHTSKWQRPLASVGAAAKSGDVFGINSHLLTLNTHTHTQFLKKKTQKSSIHLALHNRSLWTPRGPKLILKDVIYFFFSWNLRCSHQLNSDTYPVKTWFRVERKSGNKSLKSFWRFGSHQMSCTEPFYVFSLFFPSVLKHVPRYFAVKLRKCFGRLKNTRLSISMRVSRQWLTFHVWVKPKIKRSAYIRTFVIRIQTNTLIV